jgi:serine/threonine protein kinase
MIAFFSSFPPTSPRTPVDVRSPELILQSTISAAQDVWAFGCLIYLLFKSSSLFELSVMGDSGDLDDDHILQMIALLGRLPEDLKSAWPRYRNYFDEQGVQTTFEVDCAPSFGSLDDLMEDGNLDDLAQDEDLDTAEVDLIEDDKQDNVDKGMPDGPGNTYPPQANKESTQELYPSLIEVYQRPHSDKTENSHITQGPTWPPLRDRWLQDKHPAMASEESEAVADLLHKIFRYEPAERLTVREILKHPWIRGFCMNNII